LREPLLIAEAITLRGRGEHRGVLAAQASARPRRCRATSVEHVWQPVRWDVDPVGVLLGAILGEARHARVDARANQGDPERRSSVQRPHEDHGRLLVASNDRLGQQLLFEVVPDRGNQEIGVVHLGRDHVGMAEVLDLRQSRISQSTTSTLRFSRSGSGD
jgi:hypothetical protein